MINSVDITSGIHQQSEISNAFGHEKSKTRTASKSGISGDHSSGKSPTLDPDSGRSESTDRGDITESPCQHKPDLIAVSDFLNELKPPLGTRYLKKYCEYLHVKTESK
ncbi:uncharacterized protein LOC128396281 isoform X2 [Panonychus citri]|uniref:uncharacterized protein LOC128396281 isoform X2 n=1 Tax=Panonychus citri TaxID=50023 RepID=UPI0023082DAD|nr:uncharacterized protein LOC128396281 isoform X2 [Panonychus citri]XP_053212815.1 uncharacterized protein LOC128396281 isoform X2 [Panonychus citri]XP_053212816.1 uncharacterized protein LOC128396281 isoform X2 [Panonychus citri]XP_053212817.1 uncharacterized protein LOC128396281 isoform X2 [Panonychus citri]